MSHRLVMLFLMAALSLSGCGSKSKEALYAEGVKKHKEGNPGAAIVLYRNALEKDQNYQDARFQLGRAYLSAGKYEQAEKELQKVLLANPGRVEVRYELARAYNGLRKPDQAIKEIQEYLKTKPETAEVFEVLGTAEAMNGKLDLAEQDLLKALKLEPNRVSAKLELAGIYYGQKKADQAKELLTGIIKDKPTEAKAYGMLAQIELLQGNKENALKVFQAQAAVEPKNPVPLYKIGILYNDMGQTDKAAEVADKLLEKFPKRAEGLRLKGMLDFQKKNFTEAIASLQKANAMQPTMEGYYYLGMSQYGKKEYESALSQFRSILDRAPNANQIRVMVAMIYLNQKRLDDAVAELQKILKSDDKNAMAHNLLGNVYMAKGMFSEGMKELNRATDLNPKLVDAYLKKGVYHMSSGNEKESENDLKSAVQVAPDVVNNRLVLAAYYVKVKNYDKALDVLRQGLTKGKTDAPLYNNIASILFIQKKNSEALAALQKAKEVDPAFLNTYFNAATYYFATKEPDKAVAEYQAALQKDPQNLKALLTLASYYESKGRDSEAISYFDKAVATKNPSANVALANYYMKKKQSDKAIDTIDSAIKQTPRNPDLLELKGRIYLLDKKSRDAISVFDQVETINQERGLNLKLQTYVAVKEYDKAIEQAQRLIRLKPQSGQGYMMLAEIYEKQNKYDRAIDELKNGMRADSANAGLQMQLAHTYARKKDYAQALNTFNDILRKFPKTAAPVLFGVGSIYEEQGKKLEAAKKYREALQKQPDYAPALNNLATLYADGIGGKPAEGLTLIEKAARAQATDPNILDTYGYVLLKNGRVADARKALERAATYLPDNPTVNYHLALMYRDAGDRAQAMAKVDKALAGGPFLEEPQARQLRAELAGGKKAR